MRDTTSIESQIRLDLEEAQADLGQKQPCKLGCRCIPCEIQDHVLDALDHAWPAHLGGESIHDWAP